MRRALLILVATALLIGGDARKEAKKHVEDNDSGDGSKLTTAYRWKTIDFTFPSPASRHAMIHQGLYIPPNCIPLDVGMHEGRTFVSLPRFKAGVPATLATVSHHGNAASPLLDPYPNWSWHKPGHCEGLTSVFRFKIDECERIWVLDTGSINIFSGIRHVCPKQIVVFDLNTDKMIRRHRFPQSVIKPDTILTTIVVDVREQRKWGHDDKDDHDHHHHHRGDHDRKTCRNAYAYISDTTTYGLIVYDFKNDRSWRITANAFWPVPKYGFFQIEGSTFDLMDGILGLALSPYVGNKPRTLYFHALASTLENHVSTKILQNETLFLNNTNTAQREFKTYLSERRGQSAAMDISPSGIMFYTELVSNTLKCYNTKLRYNGANNPTVAHDDVRLQFATGLKVVVNSVGEEEVWILTDRLQKLIDGTINDKEVNFRVLKASVDSLIKGTNCALDATPIRFGDDRSEDDNLGRVIFREDDVSL